MDEQLESVVSLLESILRRLLGEHEELLGLMDRKRDAMRTGQARAMVELCGLENEKVQAIRDLEKKRLELVSQLTLLVNPKASEPMRMADVAAHLTRPLRDHLTLLRDQLRQRMLAVSRRASVARRAADSLVRHVQGMVQSVSVASIDVSTYGRHSVPASKASTVSTLNLTA